MAPRGIDWFTSQVFTRTGLTDLPAHLQGHYGVDAFVSRYRRHVTLEEAELTALPLAIAARPLTMSIWSLAIGRGTVSKACHDYEAATQQAQEIASRARQP